MARLEKEKLLSRLSAYIQTDQNGCHAWTRSTNRNGYGCAWDGERLWGAHRLFYTLLVGEIPEGMTIDHLCRNRACCNPDHLECVTSKENILRGEGTSAKHARQTHCIRGHPLFGENLMMRSDGRRQCHTCVKKRRQIRYLRSRQGSPGEH